LLPMITSVSEVEEASRLLKQAYFEVAEEQGCAVGVNLFQPQLGVMIEVPAAIYQLPMLASKVDFPLPLGPVIASRSPTPMQKCKLRKISSVEPPEAKHLLMSISSKSGVASVI